MAINPFSLYPGKMDNPDAEYPWGKARNVTLPGDATGTPYDQAMINDWLGFQAFCLSLGAISANGTPDTGLASQVYEGLLKGSFVAVLAGAGVWNRPAGIQGAKITLIGGGGSGGVSGSNGQASGGGAGATTVAWRNLSGSPSYVYEVGAGGAAVVNTGNGIAGSRTEFDGTSLTANGGGGGFQSRGDGPGVGGSSFTGDMSITGGDGHYSEPDVGSSNGAAGRGGLSSLHPGALGGRFAQNGEPGNRGSGGGGSYSSTGTSGAGGTGLIIIEWGIGAPDNLQP